MPCGKTTPIAHKCAWVLRSKWFLSIAVSAEALGLLTDTGFVNKSSIVLIRFADFTIVDFFAIFFTDKFSDSP
jgi:hypothetical protein